MNVKFNGHGLLLYHARKYLRRGILSFCVSAAMVLAVSAPLRAEEETMPDTFMLRFGGYQARNADTIMRLDSNYGVGAYIDFHETLGGETRATLFRLDGLHRFNDKHSLSFSWYDLQFTGSRVLTADIDWGDQTFPIDTQIDSELRFNVYKLDYKYSLFHNEKVDLGVSAGLHIMKIFAGIEASGVGQSKNEAITAPLPVFGLFADYNFTPRLSAFYHYQFFFINYEDAVKGGLQDFLIGLEYRLFRNVALGAAYNRFGLHLEAEGDDSTLHLDTNWNGGILYGAVYF